MTTPVWQPGTIYAPGSLVQPLSAPAPQPDPILNGGFELGNTGWTLSSGFSIGQFGVGTHFEGTWSLQWDLTDTDRAVNNNVAEVVPGQTVNASCMVQQGQSDSGDAGALVEVLWYDSSDEFLSSSVGNLVNSGSNQTWKPSNVSAVAPAGAAFARFAVNAFRTGGGHELWVDNCQWDAVIATAPTGLVFKAVQATAGYSGQSEPVWPLINGQTVVDNEVTWEAVFATRVVWEASPILVSGEYEPTWPDVPGAQVSDGTIRWVAMEARVTDEKCPHSKVVAIAASKIFAADEDIIAFSATVNPLDWSTEEDAGYIPFGLNTYGATPVTAMGLYRSNLVAFNSEAYQMWQVDEDPANMAILDASPVACLFPKSVQPVSNDLVMCTPEGVRNIGIAGASTNLQAGYFGAQIDPLVLAKIRTEDVRFALFWPAMGQYWLVCDDGTAGSVAFVLTMNGGAKDQSWSRYIFPAVLTDWAILGGDLYLRAEDLIWKVDPEVLEDDVHGEGTGILCGEAAEWHSQVGCEVIEPPVNFDDDTYTFAPEASNDERTVIAGNAGALPEEINFPYEVIVEPDPGDTLYLWYSEEPFGANPLYVELTGSSGTAVVPTTATGFFEWGVTTQQGGGITLESGTVQVTCEEEEVGEPFEGYIAWPYLDFGLLGTDKMMEGFDIVADGTFRVSFGYSQRDTSLATPDYALDGDTLTGSMVPMPLTAPSFQFRLTFDASQAWEWFASNLYINNEGTG